jgi:hypothetical protein
VYVVLCAISFDRDVILCDVCCLWCLIVLPLPSGKNPFAVKIIIIVIIIIIINIQQHVT